MLGWLRNWFRRRPAPLDPDRFAQACRRVRGVRRLSAAERQALRDLTERFASEKEFVAANGFELTEDIRIAIAVQACIPILHLGLDAYRHFRSIYVFPGAFRERDTGEWQPGRHRGALAGVAIHGGGVALAWTESRRGFRDDDDGYNPVIHEFVHQLDMLDGAIDGRPPLPPSVTQREWYEAFAAAFADFRQRIEQGLPTRMSSYAATDPAEFFAVTSEVYFEDPDVLAAEYPAVLRLLRAFFRQQPPD